MIKETTQLQGFNGLKLPRLKGTVEIKLHNPTTGKTEIHKGENMITNAVYDIFAANYCGTMNYANLLPVATKMFGGILCFNTDLDTSSANAATDYYIPDGSVNNIIAHAGQTTLTDQADDLTRGNPLSSSMSLEDGSATLAWEWGVTAGNGTFKSLALTHTDTGSYGVGVNGTAYKNSFTTVTTGSVLAIDRPIHFVDADGYAYNFSVSGKTITFNKYPIARTAAGVIETLGPQADFVETFTVTTNNSTGTSFQAMPGFYFDINANKLWLFIVSTNDANTLNIEEINMSTKAATHHSITNSDISFFNYADEGRANGFAVEVYDGYVYIFQRPNGFDPVSTVCYKINLSNQADVTQISVPTAANFMAPGFPAPITGKIFPSSEWIINNGTCYKAAQTDSYEYQSGYQRLGFSTKMTANGLTGLVSRIYSTNEFAVRISKLYLATKYNLDSTVTKSASQSMIITYTLTEVSPNANE